MRDKRHGYRFSIELVRRVHRRAVVWLRRHRHLDERSAEERGNDAAEHEPMDAFAALALAGGSQTANASSSTSAVSSLRPSR